MLCPALHPSPLVLDGTASQYQPCKQIGHSRNGFNNGLNWPAPAGAMKRSWLRFAQLNSRQEAFLKVGLEILSQVGL